MSSRLLVATTLVVGLLAGIAHPVSADDTDSVGVNAQAGESSAEGALIVGHGNQVLHRLPSTPARGGSGRRWTCTFYVLMNDIYEGYSPGLTEYQLERVTPTDGGHYVLICTDEAGNRVVDRLTQYNAADPAALIGEDGAPQIDLQAVAVRIEALRPTVRTSPAAERPQIVNIETWFWIDSWDELDATGEVDGYRIQLRATPVALIVDPGDGSDDIVCTKETAVAWTPDGPDDTRCGHRFFRKSADEPDQRFHVRARLRYQNVTWTATGPGGTPIAGAPLPQIVGAETDLPLTVHEYQAVIR